MISLFIHNDSVQNLSLSSQIHNSIFERNSFLNEKAPTLIEYAVFYGTIQIVKYLSINQVELNPSLWIYVIHLNNQEIVHFLQENNVKPKKDNIKDVFCNRLNVIIMRFLNTSTINY